MKRRVFFSTPLLGVFARCEKPLDKRYGNWGPPMNYCYGRIDGVGAYRHGIVIPYWGQKLKPGWFKDGPGGKRYWIEA